MTRYIRLNGKWVPCRILKSGARLITAQRGNSRYQMPDASAPIN